MTVLAHLPPGLMLDIGAAAGGITKRMLESSPNSRVIAFEPFPGNYPHFDKIVGNDSRVTLTKAAVAAKAHKGRLFVSATVSGEKAGREWPDILPPASWSARMTSGAKRPSLSIRSASTT